MLISPACPCGEREDFLLLWLPAVASGVEKFSFGELEEHFNKCSKIDCFFNV